MTRYWSDTMLLSLKGVLSVRVMESISLSSSLCFYHTID